MSEWRDMAACKGKSELFFPPATAGRGALNEARKICARCPVQEPCLEYALTEMSTFDDGAGMYAGTTAMERRVLRSPP
jgi:WhiB family transcriptional regulator, redox-sensing transcriptional regulator